MKNSGIEWIGEVPNSWEIRRTKYVATSIFKGYGITKEDIVTDGDTPCVRYGEIYTKYNISFEDCKTRTNKSNIAILQYFHFGDILFAGTGELVDEIGKNIVYLGKEKCLAGGDIIVLRHKQNPIFLNYALYATCSQIQKSRGKAKLKVVHISATEIGNIYIALPSIVEQRQIAAHLDKKCAAIDSMVANQQAQIEKLKEYKQSVITEAVTKGLDPSVPMKPSGVEWIGEVPAKWIIQPLKCLFSFGKGLPITKADLVSVGIKVISYGQIHAKYNKSTTIDDKLYRYVSEKYLNTNNDSIVHKGDFIFADTSEDVEGSGDFIYIDKDDKIFAGYHSVILKNRYEYKTNNKYLAYLFLSNNWKSQLQSRVSGIKVFSISRGMLAKTSVLLPTLSEQQQIADHLDKKCAEIDKLISVKQQKIEKLNEYKKLLIYEYVTGKKEVG